MDSMQMDLFDFAAMEAAQNAPEAVKVVLRNFPNDERIDVPITSKQRIEANFNAIRLLKSLDGAERALERAEQTTPVKSPSATGITGVGICIIISLHGTWDCLKPDGTAVLPTSSSTLYT